MTREARSLELRPETWQQLQDLNDLLQHDDLEETVLVLIQLGHKAITVTDPRDRTVRLFGGERTSRDVACVNPKCGEVFKHNVYPREAALKLAMDTQSENKDASSIS